MEEEQEFNYINVIPFVDIMLVLLTIVLTTSTFLTTGVLPISLPKVSEAQTKSLKSMIIEIDVSGSIYFNSKPINLRDLKELIKKYDTTTHVLIRADKNIALQVFVDVLDLVKEFGFEKINLQTEGVK
ncbi:MAG: biopolymer transporter ExbD [Planctomycetes bacterium]|nr:biopolymer transporter ExbD [Planctomycetota bacterium]